MEKFNEFLQSQNCSCLINFLAFFYNKRGGVQAAARFAWQNLTQPHASGALYARSRIPLKRPQNCCELQRLRIDILPALKGEACRALGQQYSTL
jgi:hypothetical protein